MFDIPIITYHKISNHREFGQTTISLDVFKSQIRYLSKAGFTSIHFKDLFSGKDIPSKSIIITFDDGYENIYHNALPVLLENNYKAVIFIVTDFLGKKNSWEALNFQHNYKHLSSEQILELNNYGFEIGSHGKTHRYLPLLKERDLEDELINSKQYLEQIISDPVISFCYPYGRFTKKIKQCVARAGYFFATSNLQPFKKKQHDQLALFRRSIYTIDSFKIFKSKIKPIASYSTAYLSEFLIQQGALVSIALNAIR